jgi:hypothetical protein
MVFGIDYHHLSNPATPSNTWHPSSSRIFLSTPILRLISWRGPQYPPWLHEQTLAGSTAIYLKMISYSHSFKAKVQI